MMERFLLGVPLRIVAVEGIKDPMLISVTDDPDEASFAVLMPNDWEVSISGKGTDDMRISAIPVYHQANPKTVFIKGAVVLKGMES